jgi:predicted dehydrogenase
VRIAIVGAGLHGHDHARALAALQTAGRDVQLAAVVDAAPDRAAALAGAFGVDRSGPPTLLEDLDVDAVDVCAPTDRHREIAETCARRRLPTLIEKPLAPNLADADAIIDAFARTDTLLVPGHSTRFDPAARQVARALREGLGRLGLLAVHVYQGYAWRDGWRAWQLDAARSGGRIVHLGIHDIDLVCWLAGAEPICIRAIGRRRSDERPGAWSSYALQLQFDGGAVATVTADWCATPAHVLRRTLLAIGADGRARYDSADDEHVVLGTGGPDRLAGYNASIRDQLRHWIDCLQGRAQPLVPVETPRTALRAALAAERTAASDGAVIDLGTDDRG